MVKVENIPPYLKANAKWYGNMTMPYKGVPLEGCRKGVENEQFKQTAL